MEPTRHSDNIDNKQFPPSKEKRADIKKGFAKDILLDAVDYAVQAVKAARTGEAKLVTALATNDHSPSLADQVAAYFSVAQTFADLARKGACVAVDFSKHRTLAHLYREEPEFEQRMRFEHFVATVRASNNACAPSLLDQAAAQSKLNKHRRTNSEYWNGGELERRDGCRSPIIDRKPPHPTQVHNWATSGDPFTPKKNSNSDYFSTTALTGVEKTLVPILNRLTVRDRRGHGTDSLDVQAEHLCLDRMGNDVQAKLGANVVHKDIRSCKARAACRVRSFEREVQCTIAEFGDLGEETQHNRDDTDVFMKGNPYLLKQWIDHQAYFRECRQTFWPVLRGVRPMCQGNQDADANPLRYIDESPSEPLPRPSQFKRPPPDINIRRLVNWEFRPAAKYLDGQRDYKDESPFGLSPPLSPQPPIGERIVSLESMYPRILACSVQWPPNKQTHELDD